MQCHNFPASARLLRLCNSTSATAARIEDLLLAGVFPVKSLKPLVSTAGRRSPPSLAKTVDQLCRILGPGPSNGAALQMRACGTPRCSNGVEAPYMSE